MFAHGILRIKKEEPTILKTNTRKISAALLEKKRMLARELTAAAHYSTRVVAFHRVSLVLLS